MINFNTLPQSVAAALGAIVLSVTFLSASVGPVHADQLHPTQTSAQASA